MEAQQKLYSFLQKIHPVDKSILEEYLLAWKPFSCPGKSIMTAEGETERFMYFVSEGIQKSYHLSGGREHIIAFTYPPSFTGIPDSFFTQSPSPHFLETITDSRFLRLSFERHQELMERHRQIETLFRKAAEQLLVGVLQRHVELMSQDIETRFRNFAARSPHMINMISRKDLASYLRMDPTNLSKLLGSIKID